MCCTTCNCDSKWSLYAFVIDDEITIWTIAIVSDIFRSGSVFVFFCSLFGQICSWKEVNESGWTKKRPTQSTRRQLKQCSHFSLILTRNYIVHLHCSCFPNVESNLFQKCRMKKKWNVNLFHWNRSMLHLPLLAVGRHPEDVVAAQILLVSAILIVLRIVPLPHRNQVVEVVFCQLNHQRPIPWSFSHENTCVLQTDWKVSHLVELENLYLLFILCFVFSCIDLQIGVSFNRVETIRRVTISKQQTFEIVIMW
jgi:hypothetical protein